MDHGLRLHGVGLEQHAGVSAALAEGLPLGEVLAQEQIPAPAWPEADRAWREALADSPDLLLRYLRSRRRAEDCLDRRVAPLEDDATAWAGLLGALTLAEDPEKLLTPLGLRMTDLARLGRRWRAKAEGDPALAERLTQLAGKVSPPTEVRCGPTVLRPFPWTPAAEAPRAEDAPREPAVAAAPAAVEAPAVVVPSYLREAPAPVLVETLGPAAAPPRQPLPFGEQPSPAFLESMVAGPPAAPPAQSGETLGAAVVKAGEVLPFPRAPLSPGETLPVGPGAPQAAPLPFSLDGQPEEPYGLNLAQYASLWAELAIFPERAPAVLARYRLPDEAARKKLNEAWGKRFMKDPAQRRAWMDLCARYREWLQQQTGSGR